MSDIIQELLRTKAATLGYFELEGADMERTYSPGKWTIRQILLHLVDAETVLYDRIRRGIANPGQVVWGFDQDLWAEGLEYKSLPIEEARATYEAIRNNIITLARRYYQSHGSNTYVHSETGLRTVKEEFDKVVWHNDHHLQQAKTAMGTC
ncbi:MAG: DinB family protein [Bacteroidia bacterium]|nr:DinB family protein [Bacteroidia bacterium]